MRQNSTLGASCGEYTLRNNVFFWRRAAGVGVGRPPTHDSSWDLHFVSVELVVRVHYVCTHLLGFQQSASTYIIVKAVEYHPAYIHI